ncbi:MAG: AEC family transporter [Armatimonadota bacterium]
MTDAFSTVVSVFLLLLAGYGAKKIGFLKPSDTRAVNSIVIYLTMPSFIFVSLYGQSIDSAMVKAPAVGILMEMVVLGLAYLAAKMLKLNRPTTGGLMLAATFGNTGFLGYPMVGAAFPNNSRAMPSAVMFDEFAMAMIMNSVGVAVAASYAGKCFQWSSLLEFLKTPLFPATVVGLVLRNANIPPVILKTLGFLAAGTVPLAMLSIGLSLSTASLKKYPAPLGVGFLLKMVVLPLLVAAALPLVGVTGIVRQVSILLSAVPTAVVTGVIAGRYGANEEFVAGAIFVMTLLSVAVLPAVLILV